MISIKFHLSNVKCVVSWCSSLLKVAGLSKAPTIMMRRQRVTPASCIRCSPSIDWRVQQTWQTKDWKTGTYSNNGVLPGEETGPGRSVVAVRLAESSELSGGGRSSGPAGDPMISSHHLFFYTHQTGPMRTYRSASTASDRTKQGIHLPKPRL